MTPEQLEKLAAAREKAKAVKDAMKSENDDQKIRILQAKMDAIKKTSKKKPENPEPPPDPESPNLNLNPKPNLNLGKQSAQWSPTHGLYCIQYRPLFAETQNSA